MPFVTLCRLGGPIDFKPTPPYNRITAATPLGGGHGDTAVATNAWHWGSETNCQRRMTDPLLQSVTGSSNAIGTMLSLGTGNGRIQIRDHHPPNTANGVESDAATNAPIARSLSATP